MPWEGKGRRLTVPHCWCSEIGIAASAYLAAAVPHCPFILPANLPGFPLRIEFVSDGFHVRNGLLSLPDKPGLRVELKAGCPGKVQG